MGLNTRSPSRRANARPNPASGPRIHLRPPCWHSSQASNPIAAAFNGPPKGQGQRSSTQATAGPQPPASPTLSPDAPLDRDAFATLQEQLKALAAGHCDAFARPFRTAFQVALDTLSVAPLILQERHRIWIEEIIAKANRG
jgi:hypothetical protein